MKLGEKVLVTLTGKVTPEERDDFARWCAVSRTSVSAGVRWATMQAVQPWLESQRPGKAASTSPAGSPMLPARLAEKLERCRPWIEAALARNSDGFTWATVEGRIAAGQATLWPASRSAMITTLLTTPEGGCCHVWLAGGDLRQLIAMSPGLASWAEAQGATHATLVGRRGWARVLASHGWRIVGSELRLEL